MAGSCEHWCHVYDGVVHAGAYSNGTLHTYSVSNEEEDCVRISHDIPMSELRPWGDRRLFELPVCGVCESDVSEMVEMFEEAVCEGFFDDLEIL